MSKNKFDFESGGLTSEQTAKLQELMAVLEKANNDLKGMIVILEEKVDTSIKVDTLEITPMGEVIHNLNNMPRKRFLHWLADNQDKLLGFEREITQFSFEQGCREKLIDDDFFDKNYKQTL